jgi:hypothetical protein
VQRAAQQQAAAEAQARGRVAKVRNDLAERTGALERAAAAAEASGSLIELHAAAVDAAIVALNGQLATGIAWHELERLLEEERTRGAPVACMIASLDLANSRATLLLPDADGDSGGSDSDGAQGACMRVPCDCSLDVTIACACMHADWGWCVQGRSAAPPGGDPRCGAWR